MSHNYVVFGGIGGQKNDVIMALDCSQIICCDIRTGSGSNSPTLKNRVNGTHDETLNQSRITLCE